MPKKKFSETEVGKFLTKIGSSIGGILPEKGFLGVLRQLITKDKQLTPKDKETACARRLLACAHTCWAVPGRSTTCTYTYNVHVKTQPLFLLLLKKN